MNRRLNRREVLGEMALAGTGLALSRSLRADSPSNSESAPFRTPFKFDKLVLSASPEEGAFDGRSVDDPFVYLHEGAFYMLYIGFDGGGYQTGLAKSPDLVTWERIACVARRDPNSRYTKYNIALSCLVRDHQLNGSGTLKTVHGRYLGAWNAYPNAGYEVGAAVIGLAWSDDLLHWELTDPILFPKTAYPGNMGAFTAPI